MSDVTINVPMVINKCYGGFSLSRAASEEIARRKGLKTRIENNFLYVGDDYDAVENVVPRNDPDLIDVVHEMGHKANGECSKLAIVNVEVSLSIDSYDGKEKVVVSGYAE